MFFQLTVKLTCQCTENNIHHQNGCKRVTQIKSSSLTKGDFLYLVEKSNDRVEVSETVYEITPDSSFDEERHARIKDTSTVSNYKGNTIMVNVVTTKVKGMHKKAVGMKNNISG